MLYFLLLKSKYKCCTELRRRYFDYNAVRECGILKSRNENLYHCLNAFFKWLIWIYFIFALCYLAYLSKMLGLTVRCVVQTNYKPLYVELELKSALFYGTLLPFSELYIFVTFYDSCFILRIVLLF